MEEMRDEHVGERSGARLRSHVSEEKTHGKTETLTAMDGDANNDDEKERNVGEGEGSREGNQPETMANGASASGVALVPQNEDADAAGVVVPTSDGCAFAAVPVHNPAVPKVCIGGGTLSAGNEHPATPSAFANVQMMRKVQSMQTIFSGSFAQVAAAAAAACATPTSPMSASATPTVAQAQAAAAMAQGIFQKAAPAAKVASAAAKKKAADKGYHSDGMMHTNSKGRERKKGTPWTEEEHRLFLLGLHKLGKGDWRGISRNYVHSRTPTQVASHAQKYFIRQSNVTKRKRRASLFDIAPDMKNPPAVPPPPPAPPAQPKRSAAQRAQTDASSKAGRGGAAGASASVSGQRESALIEASKVFAQAQHSGSETVAQQHQWEHQPSAIVAAAAAAAAAEPATSMPAPPDIAAQPHHIAPFYMGGAGVNPLLMQIAMARMTQAAGGGGSMPAGFDGQEQMDVQLQAKLQQDHDQYFAIHQRQGQDAAEGSSNFGPMPPMPMPMPAHFNALFPFLSQYPTAVTSQNLPMPLTNFSTFKNWSQLSMSNGMSETLKNEKGTVRRPIPIHPNDGGRVETS